MKNWIFILLTFSLYSQTENSEFNNYDFSNFLLNNEVYLKNETTQKPETLGFIGNNYQRFYIKFLWIEKDTKNPKQYLVKGKIMFNDYKANISGTIVLTSNLSNENCSIIKGNYYFHEGPNYEIITAIYEGSLISKYNIPNNKIEYCINGFGNNDFLNNQFSGTRKDLINNKIEICNWGDYRIPNSSDLDIGTKQFSPNEKYFKNDWASYVLAHAMPYCDSNGIHYPNAENYVWWNK
jgi:hypothetical protein